MQSAVFNSKIATLVLFVALLSQPVVADGIDPLKYEDDQVSMRLVLRTPEQLSAFYQGRGFNQAAIDRILETCFITPIIHNKTLDAVWLELDNWQFDAGRQSIARITRDYWSGKWQRGRIAASTAVHLWLDAHARGA